MIPDTNWVSDTLPYWRQLPQHLANMEFFYTPFLFLAAFSSSLVAFWYGPVEQWAFINTVPSKVQQWAALLTYHHGTTRQNCSRKVVESFNTNQRIPGVTRYLVRKARWNTYGPRYRKAQLSKRDATDRPENRLYGQVLQTRQKPQISQQEFAME